jgi:hypothetical protein
MDGISRRLCLRHGTIPFTTAHSQHTSLNQDSQAELIPVYIQQVFGYTPDETAFARLWLERETVPNALTMVQPALLSYGLGSPPQPVLLDVASIQVPLDRRRPPAIASSAVPCGRAERRMPHAGGCDPTTARSQLFLIRTGLVLTSLSLS